MNHTLSPLNSASFDAHFGTIKHHGKADELPTQFCSYHGHINAMDSMSTIEIWFESREWAIGTRAIGNLGSLSPPGQVCRSQYTIQRPFDASQGNVIKTFRRIRHPHAHKSHPKILANRPTKNKWKSAKRVGYMFVAIANKERKCSLHYPQWCSKTQQMTTQFLYRWKEWDEALNSRSITCAFLVEQGQWKNLHAKPSEWQKVWKIWKFGVAMGGDPVTTEPAVLVVDEEVRSILEEAGFLAFFNKFKGHSEGITRRFVDSWKDGCVIVDKIDFSVSAGLIAEVSGLPNEGEVISREKMNQVSRLTKFIKEKETFCWLDSGIARESLPKPWDRVAMVLMKYLTLEGKFRKLFGHHIAFLNFVRNKEKVNIPSFLFNSLEKSLVEAKSGKGKSPLHQGLMKMLFDFVSSKNSPAAGPSKGEEDGDSESQEKESPVKIPIVKGGRKRKTPAHVLSSNLAKCSRRSSRLQQKLVGKASLQDVADSSEEERNLEDPTPPSGKISPPKGPAAATATAPAEKEESPGGPLMVTEELRCHLRVLNSLGSSLSSTCACANLLTIEVTNYLKEVLKIMKEKNPEKE
eukprot:Gb_36378 [translate_table: standard]